MMGCTGTASAPLTASRVCDPPAASERTPSSAATHAGASPSITIS